MDFALLRTYLLTFISHPIVAAANGGMGLFAGISTLFGVFNAILGTLIAIVGLATAIVGLIIKIKKLRQGDK